MGLVLQPREDFSAFSSSPPSRRQAAAAWKTSFQKAHLRTLPLGLLFRQPVWAGACSAPRGCSPSRPGKVVGAGTGLGMKESQTNWEALAALGFWGHLLQLCTPFCVWPRPRWPLAVARCQPCGPLQLAVPFPRGTERGRRATEGLALQARGWVRAGGWPVVGASEGPGAVCDFRARKPAAADPATLPHALSPLPGSLQPRFLASGVEGLLVCPRDLPPRVVPPCAGVAVCGSWEQSGVAESSEGGGGCNHCPGRAVPHP